MPHTHTKPASNRIRLFEIPQTLKPLGFLCWWIMGGPVVTKLSLVTDVSLCGDDVRGPIKVADQCLGARGAPAQIRLGSAPCCQTKARSCLVSPLAATLPGHSAARCVATPTTRHGSYFCTFKTNFNKSCRLYPVDERPQFERITSLNAMVFISSVSCRAV